MDYNGVLWILQKSVNGLGKTSMDVYGMFQGRRSDPQKYQPENSVNTRVCGLENRFDHKMTTN